MARATGTIAISSRVTASTFTETLVATWPSATASTSVWAPPLPASKAGSRWKKCCNDFLIGKSTTTGRDGPRHQRCVAGRPSRFASHDSGIGRPEGDAMNLEDMILVSIDDHMIEPPHMY